MAGKSHLLAPIVNNAIQDELLWFTKCAKESNGIFFLKTVAWDPTGPQIIFMEPSWDKGQVCLDGFLLMGHRF